MPLFQYVTVQRVRDLGIADAPAGLADADVVRLIQDASEWVNERTGQFFMPRYEVSKMNGNSSPVVRRDDMVPVLAADKVEVDLDKTSGEKRQEALMFGVDSILEIGTGVLDPIDFSLTHDGRVIQLVQGDFPRGRGNVLVTGAFGWLQGFGEKAFETTTAAVLAEGDQLVSLTDVENATGFLEIGDVLDVFIAEVTASAPARTIQVIVQAIDEGLKQVTVDAIPFELALPLGSGAAVKALGKVPNAIQQIVEFLVVKDATAQINAATGTSAVDPDRIISEKTDNYSYRLESSTAIADKTGGLGALTGNARIDALLQRFHTPPYVGFV